MKHKLFALVPLLALSLTGCSPNEFLRNAMNRMAPDDDEAFAKECLMALIKGDLTTVTRQLDSQLVYPGIETNLIPLVTMLAHGDPISSELVGCNVFSSAGKRRSFLTYQYQFTNAWVLAGITIDTVAGNKSVSGLNGTPLEKSLREINAFTLKGKSVHHFVLLALAIIIPIFIIWTVILCARTRVPRKWLWIIFILMGIIKLNLDWTTGQMGLQPLAFQIPGSGIMKMGIYAPWILSVSFPLGAILFLIKRKKLQTNAARTANNTEPPPPPYAKSGAAE